MTENPEGKQPNEVWEDVCIQSFKEMLDNTIPHKVARQKELIEIIMRSTSKYMQSMVEDLAH